MAKWNTCLFLSHNNGTYKSDFLHIKRGIFQGDSLSPLLFCMALIPFLNELNNREYGYTIFDAKVDHLFYMNDLRIFARNDNELEGLSVTAKDFSNSIGMTFGIGKCVKVSFLNGLIQKTTDMKVDINTTTRELEPRKTYKHLGFNEGNGINLSFMKENIRKEYYRRIRLILNTKLNSKNPITAKNTLAIPVVQYSYNIID